MQLHEGVLVLLRTNTPIDERKEWVIAKNASDSRDVFRDLFHLKSGRPLKNYTIPHECVGSILLHEREDIAVAENELRGSPIILDIVSLKPQIFADNEEEDVVES